MNACFIGIDLGGTRVKIGLVANNRLISQAVVTARAAQGMAASLPIITEHVNMLLKKFALTQTSLQGVSLGFPGLVDPYQKKILSTNGKYADAHTIDLEAWVKEEWNVPFFIDNDARMAAIGEWKFGAGKNTDDLVMVTIGTGVGTAAILNGKLLRGKHFQAGCLGGHLSVQFNGRQCSCGNAGCMEAYAATWSIKEQILADKDYIDSALHDAEVIDFESLFAAAEKGDALALQIQQQCLDIWSTGVVNLIHAYDPEVVVIGGGVMQDPERILPYITHQVHQHAWCPWGTVQIRATQLGNDAGILGAVYALQHPV